MLGGLSDVFGDGALSGTGAGVEGVCVVGAFTLRYEASHLGDHPGLGRGIGEAVAETLGAAFAEFGLDEIGADAGAGGGVRARER